MIRFIISNIVWNTDGEDADHLPTEARLTLGDASDIADALSDDFGCLVSSFDVEEVNDGQTDFIVVYCLYGDIKPQVFECWAENAEHAREQCINADPGAKWVKVYAPVN